jgi:hypothetical protein
MAKILLHRDEVEEQALPFVCLRCGRPASLWKTKSFLLASRAAGKLTQIEVPLCSAHGSHWFWRGLFGGGVGGVLVTLFLVGMAAVAEPETIPPSWRAPIMVCFGLGFFGLVLWLPVMLVVYFTSIRPAKIGADDITLAGVSSEFVGKLKEYRQSHPRERKSTRRASRRRRGEHEG